MALGLSLTLGMDLGLARMAFFFIVFISKR